MKKLLFALPMLLWGHSAVAQNINPLITGYMDIKNALVNSDSKTAASATLALQTLVKAEAAFPEKSALLDALQAMSKTSELEKQRTAFPDLSIVLWKVVHRVGKTDKTIYYQYCPMKKAYWLSLEKDIKNPYYGSSMLTCGKIAETH